MGLLRVSCLLPYPVLVRLGRSLGQLALPLARQRAGIARTNIARCLPESNEAEREQILRKNFVSLGISLFEVPLAWWARGQRLEKLAEIEGLENLRDAAAAGKGVLLLSAHFTCLEIGGRLLARQFPFHALYRPSANPVVDYLMAKGRLRTCEKIIPRDAPKEIIRSLRGGNAVWYAPDQNTQRKKAVFAKFFGHAASTTPATHKLAALTGARVVPFKVVRKTDNSGYKLTLEPALDDFPTDDVQADTQRINDIIERWVREAPDQYLWIHRRFRTRPNREDPPFY
jgi:KDO2-lipid IV(A) lauroyltransferase